MSAHGLLIYMCLPGKETGENNGCFKIASILSQNIMLLNK